MYRVIAPFIDLVDGEHPYHVGDAYPLEGHIASEARIKELSTDRNKLKKPLIEEVPEPVAEVKKTPKAPVKAKAATKEPKNDRSGSSGTVKSGLRKKK